MSDRLPSNGPAQVLDERARRFRDAYGRHRESEGRGRERTDPVVLPFLLPNGRNDGLARDWGVRARTFVRFMRAIVAVRAAEVAPRPLRVLDLGAGSGWLGYRIAQHGHEAVALDVRTDDVDGLGAASVYRARLLRPFARVAASFEALPLAAASCDIAVFNASLHYALDLRVALNEAAHIVMRGGRIAILDSPFYAGEKPGQAMVEEKRSRAGERFGALADDLMALPFIEFLTRDRLADASASLGLRWRRHRVRYPLWYEARPLVARLKRRRAPSRFDLWETVVP